MDMYAVDRMQAVRETRKSCREKRVRSVAAEGREIITFDMLPRRHCECRMLANHGGGLGKHGVCGSPR